MYCIYATQYIYIYLFLLQTNVRDHHRSSWLIQGPTRKKIQLSFINTSTMRGKDFYHPNDSMYLIPWFKKDEKVGKTIICFFLLPRKLTNNNGKFRPWMKMLSPPKTGWFFQSCLFSGVSSVSSQLFGVSVAFAISDRESLHKPGRFRQFHHPNGYPLQLTSQLTTGKPQK